MKQFLVTHDASKDSGIIFANTRNQAAKIAKLLRIKNAHFTEVTLTWEQAAITRVLGWPQMLKDVDNFIKTVNSTSLLPR